MRREKIAPPVQTSKHGRRETFSRQEANVNTHVVILPQDYHMSFINAQSVAKAFDVRGLPFPEKLLLLYLAKHDGEPIPPTNKHLAEEMNCSERYLRETRGALAKRSLLCYPYERFGGRGKGSQYQLVFPQWIENEFIQKPPRLKPRSRAKLHIVGGRQAALGEVAAEVRA